MNRTLISLAIIKTHWEKNKADYIDNFIPLIANLLSENSYTEIKLGEFQVDFKKRYGLDIPKNAFITIFNRAKKKNIVKRDQGKYFYNSDYSGNEIKTIDARNIERKFNKVVASITEFAANEYKLVATNKEVEDALLSFLKTHDLDILFAAKDHSVLPQVTSTKKLEYLISSFSLFAVKQEPNLFQFLLDISVGHALSGAILYSERNPFSGKLKHLNIYFDTPLMLGLFGFNGEFKKSSIEELVKILHEEKANLYILTTTRGEIDNILADCHGYLEKGIYNLEKASKVLRYCHREEISASDLEQKILSLDSILASYNIVATSVPSHMNNKKFQIDEKDLKNTIKKVYEDTFKNYYYSEGAINQDVKVLSGIYRFRQGAKPRTLKDSKDLFITSNIALAFASRIFETKENGTHFTIPTCLTDVFLGTVIWLQSPQKTENLNTKKFISDCYSATQPTSLLINKYIQEVEKLKNEEKINKDEYYLLRTHRATLNLLEKKTMGDPDTFDGSSTTEILDSLMLSIKGKEQKKFENEKENHNQTKSKLDIAITETDKIKSKLNKKADKISHIMCSILFGLSIIILICLLILNQMSDYLELAQTSKILIGVSIVLLTSLNLSTGFNMLRLKDKLKAKIKTKILQWLEK